MPFLLLSGQKGDDGPRAIRGQMDTSITLAWCVLLSGGNKVSRSYRVDSGDAVIYGAASDLELAYSVLLLGNLVGSRWPIVGCCRGCNSPLYT